MIYKWTMTHGSVMRRKPMIRTVAWIQILIVFGCVGYSTYYMFQGDFERAFLPYPILILYYLVFLRKKAGKVSDSPEDDPEQ